MKIIQVVHSFPPEIGGIEAHVFNLSRELARKGHDVTVVTTWAPGSPGSETVEGIRVLRHWAIKLPWFSSVRHIPFLTLRLALMDADLYHSHGYGSVQPLCAALASLIKRRPFVFTLHGYPKLKGLSSILKWLYAQLAARTFLAIARRVITVTEATVPDISGEVRKEKIKTIHNGVDTRVYRAKEKLSKSKSNRIIYVGRFDAYKGIDDLIRAFATVQKAAPEAQLHIIGHDEGVRHSLESLSSQLGVRVNFGYAGPGGMPGEYEDSVAVVLPSKYEGQSLVLLEAISSERPMLSTPVGDAPRLFKEVYMEAAPNMLFGIGRHQELASKLLDIMRNRERYEKLCSLARSRLEKFYSWEAAANRTVEVYKEVV